MDEDELIGKLIEKQIDCLSKATPDDWHRVADLHNWDDELDVLYWIVQQPNCDKATARLIFWKGEPTGHDFEKFDEVMGESSYSVEPLLNFIVRRFNTDGYSRDEIEFDLFFARTGCFEVGDPNYTRAIEARTEPEFDELRDRAADVYDPLSAIHPDLLVAHSPGRRVSRYEGGQQFLDSYPVGVDFDTGELTY